MPLKHTEISSAPAYLARLSTLDSTWLVQFSLVSYPYMGNVVPLPCTCKEASVVQPTAAGAKKTRRIKQPAVDQDGGEEYAMWLKVVLTRKDAAVFVARLEERARRAAEERKTRMRMRGLGAGADVGVASPCRDTWSPRLATIAEK